jgi:hypothetical protein
MITKNKRQSFKSISKEVFLNLLLEDNSKIDKALLVFPTIDVLEKALNEVLNG